MIKKKKKWKKKKKRKDRCHIITFQLFSIGYALLKVNTKMNYHKANFTFFITIFSKKKEKKIRAQSPLKIRENLSFEKSVLFGRVSFFFFFSLSLPLTEFVIYIRCIEARRSTICCKLYKLGTAMSDKR